MWGALLKVAGGVVKADNANTELERAEAQALAMQEAKYGLEADAAAKLIPKLTYRTADDTVSNFQLGGKDVNWDLFQSCTLQRLMAKETMQKLAGRK